MKINVHLEILQIIIIQKNLTPEDYKAEMVSPGVSGIDDLNIEDILEYERTAKYGQKIYLKLQFQQFKTAIDSKNTESKHPLRHFIL